MKPGWRWLQALLAITILSVAAVMLWHQASAVTWPQLQSAWQRTSSMSIALCVACTVISFACLSGYEWFATRCAVPGRVRPRQALRIGAISHAVANTLGFHAVTGIALRYHFYRRLGLDLRDVARVVAMVASCVGSGVVLLSASALIHVGASIGRVAAFAIAIATIAVLAALAWLVRRRRDAQGEARIPARLAIAMLVVAWIEMAAAVAALYVLLPDSVSVQPAQFALLFVGAMLFGILSHVPGSIGVFEAALLAGLAQTAPAAVDQAGVLLALLAFRLLYNVLPFAIALPMLGFDALRQRGSRPRETR